jgi:hypothetical protein
MPEYTFTLSTHGALAFRASLLHFLISIFQTLLCPCADHLAVRSEAWIVFTRSNATIVDSNPTQGMDVYMCVYSVFVLSCVQVAALRRAYHSSKDSFCLCKKDYETEEEARAQQRAVDPLMNEWNNALVGNIRNMAPLPTSGTEPGKMFLVTCQCASLHVLTCKPPDEFTSKLTCTPYG